MNTNKVSLFIILGFIGGPAMLSGKSWVELSLEQSSFKFSAMLIGPKNISIRFVDLGYRDKIFEYSGDTLGLKFGIGYDKQTGQSRTLNELQVFRLASSLFYQINIDRLGYFIQSGITGSNIKGKGSHNWSIIDFPTYFFLINNGKDNLVSEDAEKSYQSYGATMNIGIPHRIGNFIVVNYRLGRTYQRLKARDSLYSDGKKINGKTYTYFPSDSARIGFEFLL